MTNPLLDTLPKNQWDALIISIVKPYYRLCNQDALITPEDIQQEAWIGLAAAAEQYDPSLGTKFTTFAYHYIRGGVIRYITKRLRNKPVQLDEDKCDLDIRMYEDNEAETADLMRTILEKVSDREDADLLIEKYVHGKSLRAIAKERGLSHETIAKRIGKLLDALEIRLKHENA